MPNRHRTTQPARAAAALALILAGTALAAPASGPTLAGLKARAAPVWRADTKDHVALRSSTGKHIRLVFVLDTEAVRYEIRGNDGSRRLAYVELPASTRLRAKP